MIRAAALALALSLAPLALAANAPRPADAHVGPGYDIEMSRMIPMRDGVQLEASAWRIPAGSRIRLVLMPLNSPYYQKNYNTGGRIGYEDPRNARVAHITLFHDQSRASVLLLPLAAEAR